MTPEEIIDMAGMYSVEGLEVEEDLYYGVTFLRLGEWGFDICPSQDDADDGSLTEWSYFLEVTDPGGSYEEWVDTPEEVAVRLHEWAGRVKGEGR